MKVTIVRLKRIHFEMEGVPGHEPICKQKVRRPILTVLRQSVTCHKCITILDRNKS